MHTLHTGNEQGARYANVIGDRKQWTIHHLDEREVMSVHGGFRGEWVGFEAVTSRLCIRGAMGVPLIWE
jgi:hypothetical protein